MKFTCAAATLMASFATVSARQLDAAEMLRQKWNMDEPIIGYVSSTNTFHLDFNTTNSTGWMIEHTNVQEEFYDENCKDDGSGFVEYVIPEGLTHPNTTDKPYMQVNSTSNTAYMTFQVNTTILANDVNVYSVVDEAEASEMGWQDKIDYGRMRFCVRSALGYGGANNSASLQSQIQDYQFKEVNFIESLITIFYDLSANFTVAAFNVEPKERLETTVSKDTYGLIAWLCNRSDTFVNSTYDLAPLRSMPPAIDEGYTNVTDNPDENPQAKYFNQGALITVCVAPDDAAWIDGIRLDGITEFDWLRNDLNTTAENSDTDTTPGSVAGDYLLYGSDAQITQNAITASGPAGNQLTSYIDSTCKEAVYCHFSSILFADFYLARGVVSGSGSATLVFATVTRRERRLGEPEEEWEEARKLQESESPFDIAVPLDITPDGPGGLRTAGGAAFGFTALATAMALLSAVLLA